MSRNVRQLLGTLLLEGQSANTVFQCNILADLLLKRFLMFKALGTDCIGMAFRKCTTANAREWAQGARCGMNQRLLESYSYYYACNRSPSVSHSDFSSPDGREWAAA